MSATTTGATLRNTGMQRAVDNERAEWIDRAVTLARRHINAMPAGALFAFEDVRAALAAAGFPEPHDHHVWGSMPRILIKAGVPMAATDRMRKASAPRTRAHNVALYVRTGGGV